MGEKVGVGIETYRLPMPTLESLATSLLASLEASWVVPWILSVVGGSVMVSRKVI